MTTLPDVLTQGSWAIYWAGPELAVNIKLFVKLLIALVLGMLVGYERSYHGHAAGMRTYGLVCMASSGLVAITGYPEAWFGGQVLATNAGDSTRVIQGIVTGIGFLGAGVIVHEQFSTRGLTSAASIWASSAIGIMVGIGFYPTAVFLTTLSAMCMALVKKLENHLPSYEGIAVILEFRKDATPSASNVIQLAREKGYEISNRSLSIVSNEIKTEWHFVVVGIDHAAEEPIAALAKQLATIEGVVGFQLAHARN